MSVLLDAFALIALLADEPAAEKVESLIRRGDTVITAVNLAEALDVLQRVERIPRKRLEEFMFPLVGEQIRLQPVDELVARDAADIRSRRYHRTRAPLSLADCILLGATRQGDSLATADRPLLRAAEAEGIDVVPLAT